MCGIFGMIGSGAISDTLNALKRLEYRGYDSAGIAAKSDGQLHIFKQAGRVEQLQTLVPADIDSSIVIGHTRWATHGEVSTANAHPFYSFDKRFAIVHNGIIENYQDLKCELVSRGAQFTSQTDSETVAHLLSINYTDSVFDAVKSVANVIEGSFAVVVTSTVDGNLYAIKNKSPLVVGVNGQSVYFCSDIRCVSSYACKVAQTPDNTIVVAEPNGKVTFYDFNGNPVSVKFFTPDKTEDLVHVDGDFMLKEILEVPDKVRQAKTGYFESGGLNLSAKIVHRIRRIYLIGCGTAYNSGLQVASSAREMLNIDVLPVIASEFIYVLSLLLISEPTRPY